MLLNILFIQLFQSCLLSSLQLHSSRFQSSPPSPALCCAIQPFNHSPETNQHLCGCWPTASRCFLLRAPPAAGSTSGRSWRGATRSHENKLELRFEILHVSLIGAWIWAAEMRVHQRTAANQLIHILLPHKQTNKQTQQVIAVVTPMMIVRSFWRENDMLVIQVQTSGCSWGRGSSLVDVWKKLCKTKDLKESQTH